MTEPTWTIKDARKLLPHRGNSVIQDWVNKGIVAAEVAEGTGHSHRFTKSQLVHLLVADYLSALGIFAKTYKGRNFIGSRPGDGNICEVFTYPDNRPQPEMRSAWNAIQYYHENHYQVLVSVDIMRVPVTTPIGQMERPVAYRGSRMKEGSLYYWVNYFPDTLEMFNEECEAWHEARTAGKGPAIAFISVLQLRDLVSRVLGIRF